MPAVGINAAINSRDFGTFRWQLNEKATPVCCALEGATNFRNGHITSIPELIGMAAIEGRECVAKLSLRQRLNCNSVGMRRQIAGLLELSHPAARVSAV